MPNRELAAVQTLTEMGYTFTGSRWTRPGRGRPHASVDLDRARALIADGNSMRATAARLGVSEATLRTRLRDDTAPEN